MTLGLTDGTTNRGLAQYNNSGFYSSTSIGSNVGSTATLGPNVGMSSISIGVITDSTKSGIVGTVTRTQISCKYVIKF